MACHIILSMQGRKGRPPLERLSQALKPYSTRGALFILRRITGDVSDYPVYQDLAFPVLPKKHGRDVVRHQQRWDPECGNPVGWAHVRLRLVNCGQRYSIEQVQGSFHVEDPHQESSAPSVSYERKNRDQSKHGGEKVCESCPIGELRRDSGVGGSWC